MFIINVIGLHVGIEARGFMFGPSIALGIGAKFVPLRKPRKLPGIFVFLLNVDSRDCVQTWSMLKLDTVGQC